VHPARDQARPEAGHACGRRTHLAGVLGAASAERSESVAARSALRWAKPVQPAGVAASCGAGLAAPALGPPAKPPPADTETHQHIAGPPAHVEATGIYGGDPSRTLVTAPARERPGRLLAADMPGEDGEIHGLIRFRADRVPRLGLRVRNHLARANRGERKRGSSAYIPWRVDAIVEPRPLAHGNHACGDSCHRGHPDHRVCRRRRRRRLLADQAVRPNCRTAARPGSASPSAPANWPPSPPASTRPRGDDGGIRGHSAEQPRT